MEETCQTVPSFRDWMARKMDHRILEDFVHPADPGFAWRRYAVLRAELTSPGDASLQSAT